MNTALTNKVALVTGASSGFGRSFCKTLAAEGASVIAVARREALLQSLVEEIEAQGGKASALALDVSDAKAVTAAFDGLEDIRIVVNNAGVAGPSTAIDCEEDEWRWTYDVNVHAAWFVSR